MTSYALYRLYDDAGRLLYVGQSSNPLSRLSTHLNSRYTRQIARIDVEHLADGTTRAQALEAERAAIIVERPGWNVKQNAVTFGPPAPADIIPTDIDTVSLVEAARILERPFESLVARVCVWNQARHWRTANGVRVAVADLPALNA